LRYFIILLIIVACSPYNRINKIRKKHPELFGKDTMSIFDTIEVKGNRIDSIFKFNSDTIRIYNDRQEIKYFYNTKTNNHYIEGKVKDTIIYKEIKVPVEVFKEQNFIERNEKLILLLLALLLLVLLILFVLLMISRKRDY